MRYYIGSSSNIDERLKAHNSGGSAYTKKFTPWQIETYITFKNKIKAEEFERYLKSGSGFAFLKKRLI